MMPDREVDGWTGTGGLIDGKKETEKVDSTDLLLSQCPTSEALCFKMFFVFLFVCLFFVCLQIMFTYI